MVLMAYATLTSNIFEVPIIVSGVIAMLFPTERRMFLSYPKIFAALIACFLLSILLPTSATAAEYDELKAQADQVQTEINERNGRIGVLEEELTQLSAKRDQLFAEKQDSSEKLENYTRMIYREKADIISDIVDAVTSLDNIPSLIRSLETLEIAFNRPYEQAHAIQEQIDGIEQNVDAVMQEKTSLENEVKERETTVASLNEQVQTAWNTIAQTQNNAIAIAGCRISYSQARFYDPDKLYPGSSDSVRIGKAIKGGSGYVRACSSAVSLAVRFSGADTSFPGGCGGQWHHMESSPRWTKIGRWNGDIGMLQPGDILVRVNGIEGQTIDHSCMYVGHDIAMQVYNTYLKGTDADVGEPTADTCFMSAHGTPNKTAAPCIGNAKWAYADKRMTVFRCVDPENSMKWANL